MSPGVGFLVQIKISIKIEIQLMILSSLQQANKGLIPYKSKMIRNNKVCKVLGRN
jgi:hypothetical protein